MRRAAAASQNREENSNNYSTAPARRAGQNLQNAAFSIKTKLQPIQNNEIVELATTAFFEWRACAGACHADNALPEPGIQPGGNRPRHSRSSHVRTRRNHTQNQFQITREVKSAL
jgi:hypothetical protein